MKKIALKLLLATFPILLLLGVYFCNDPFKVLYHYDSYFIKDGLQAVVLNKDYVSTETFINNYPTYQYDSYIFGSSRSMYYSIAEWEKHINSTKCFHFDASAESLYGIERKINFLYERHIPIKNALIIFDEQACAVTADKPDGLILRKHYLLTGKSKFDYETDYLKAFFDVNFLTSYIHYLFTHKGIDKLSLNDVPHHYDVTTNEVTFPVIENTINTKRDSFYASKAAIFYTRDTALQYSAPTIKEEQLKQLNNIKKIFAENHTSYKIAISPLYDQVKFNAADLAIMDSIFGAHNVYDFSGINDITQNKYNYYERAHYRPAVATRIMDSVYAH